MDDEALDAMTDALEGVYADIGATQVALMETMRLIKREFPDGFDRIIGNLEGNVATFTKLDRGEHALAIQGLIDEVK